MPDFFTTDVPQLSPSCCLLCKGSTDLVGFIDTGLTLGPFGRVYLCSRCVRQMGARFGMLTAEDADALRSDLRAQKGRIEELNVALAEARGAGSWQFVPDGAPVQEEESVVDEQGRRWLPTSAAAMDARDELNTCPDCGGPKAPTSKRCRACHTKKLHAGAAA